MTNYMLNRNAWNRNTLNDWDRVFRSLFEDFTSFAPETMNSATVGDPAIELSVKEDAVTATLPVPGCKSSDIEVEVVGSWLTVRAKRNSSKEDSGEGRFIRKERFSGNFEETVQIPVKVQGQDAKASCVDGVLTIVIPRENRQHGTHVISVQ